MFAIKNFVFFTIRKNFTMNEAQTLPVVDLQNVRGLGHRWIGLRL